VSCSTRSAGCHAAEQQIVGPEFPPASFSFNVFGSTMMSLIDGNPVNSPFDTPFFAPGAIGCTNEKSLSIFMDIGFRHLQRGSLVSRIVARATNNQKAAWSEVSAAPNKDTIRFGQ